MNNNLAKHYQVVASKNNQDKNPEKDGKLEEEHQNSSSCANNKYDVQLCKKNDKKSFQIEILPTYDVFAE